MMLVTPRTDQERGATVLAAGTTYIVYDINAGEMLLTGECDVTQVEPAPLRPWEPGMRALLTRPGGFGDLLFLTAIVRALTELGVEVHVCCSVGFRAAIEHHPMVAGVHDYPLTLEEVTRFDQCCWLEGILERDETGRREHAVDAMAQACGLDPAKMASKSCEVILPDFARAYAAKHFPKDDRYETGTGTPGKEPLSQRRSSRPAIYRARVGIQVRASQACRSYPPELLMEVIHGLLAAQCEVVLFGAPGTVACPEIPGIVNLTTHETLPDFIESCAVLRTCDAFIAPDSALCHAAGALEVPTLALYGPFPWALRTAYHPSVQAFTGRCPISPCFHHERGGQPFPANGACIHTGRCEALADIPPRRIVARVLTLLRNPTPSEPTKPAEPPRKEND